jgi:hypothetical protein
MRCPSVMRSTARASDVKMTSVSAGQGLVVGLPGLEPGTSSLSAIGGSALCGAAFSQVERDRQGRSNAFLAPDLARAHGGVAVAATSYSNPRLPARRWVPGGRGSPIRQGDPGFSSTRAMDGLIGGDIWSPSQLPPALDRPLPAAARGTTCQPRMVGLRLRLGDALLGQDLAQPGMLVGHSPRLPTEQPRAS